ncbi:MAG: hypothetical protein K9G58_01240 [Bacteroidales bacterium]|nr:hypothetical protein [Bacteroidales bacterium]MCF8387202.1 hypothetical protein [Bacteroidales bacterium]MCF8396759.1 hypothetical protein [Bacteroidales bacterium]
MIKNIKESKDFGSTSFAVLLYKWRKVLLIIAAVAIVLSFIFSSPVFITPLYKSSVVLFPTSTSSISKALIAENAGSEKDILEFGEDEQTERMLQVLNSSRIRDRIIDKYNLLQHYDIDTGSKYKMTKLYNMYENNITFRRTEYMAVKISVYDKDPTFAANIANDIAILLDSTINEIQRERALRGLEIVEKEYHDLQMDIRQMQDSLNNLMKLGVHDYESQAEMINRQLAIELANGNNAAVRRLENKLRNLANYGGAYVTLINSIEYSVEQLSLIKGKYKEAKVDAEQFLPQKFIVDRAYKAEKKSYPIRWLITVVTTLSSLLMGIFVIVIIENYNNIRRKSKEIYN